MVSAPAPRVYKGFTLQARTFQVRGSGLWTLDVTIGRRGSLRAFSSAETFSNEHDATVACWRMACRIIDKSPPDCRVADLSVDWPFAGSNMARKPNYGFEKRRKELERKQKQDAKLLRRQEEKQRAEEEARTPSEPVAEKE